MNHPDKTAFVDRSRYRTAVVRQLRNGPSRTSTIARASGSLMTHISRALAEIREEGIVELCVSEDVQRPRYYALTEVGEEVATDPEKLADGPVAADGGERE